MPRGSILGLLISLLIFIPGTAFAQEVDVQWGETIKENKYSEILNFVGHDDSSYYVIKGPRGYSEDEIDPNHYPGSYLNNSLETGIVQLSSEMKPIKETVIEGKKNELKHLATYKVKDHVYTFSRKFNKERKFYEIFVQSVGRQELEVKDDIRKVAEIANSSKVLDSRVDFAFSKDSSFILVYTNTQSRKKDPDKFGIHIFDRDMEPKWSKEVVLPIRESQFIVEDFIVDDLGNVYLIAKHYLVRGRETVKGRPAFEYVVYGYRNEGKEQVDYILNLRSHFLSDLHLEVAPTGDLICAGFYSDESNEVVTGTFFFTVDAKTKEIKQKSLYEFDMDFLAMNLNDRKRERLKRRIANGKGAGLNKFDIRDLVTREDGGMMLVAEQYFVRELSDYDPNASIPSLRYKYYYNDIIVISVSPQGNIEWATKIPKRQVSENDNGYYSSFALMIKGRNLHFLYNDHKVNIEEQRTEKLKNFQLDDDNGIVAMATVDSQGNVLRKPLFPNSDLNTIFRPKMCSQINANEMLIYGRNGKKTQFGRIVFQ